MTLSSKIAVYVSLTILLALPARGSTITGTVKGPDGGLFKGAFVQAQNTKTKISVSVLSDKDGRYSVPNLPAGEYDVRINAVGYKGNPRTGVNLNADQNLTFDFALQTGMVRWSDLSEYQGKTLLPEGKGKDVVTERCFICHAFQRKMVPTARDEEGWRDRVNYMRTSMHFLLGAMNFSDQNADDAVTYLTTVFGPDSILPKSPADLPKYKDVAHPPFSDEAMKIVYVEYDVPGRNPTPFSAYPAKDGKRWIPYYFGNKIAKLDPSTGALQEFQVPNEGNAAIHSAVEAPDGSVWLAEQGSNKIAKLDPKTEQITEYQDSMTSTPAKDGYTIANGSKHTVRIDSQGRVWMTGDPLSRFDPETGKFTHFEEVPTAYGIEFDKGENVWFTEFSSGFKIGKIDAKTGKVTKWAPPTPASWPRRLKIDTDGTVWFGEFEGGKLGRFDPKTQTFKEYALPGPRPTPYGLSIDREHHVWYTSEERDVIGRVDPVSGKVTEYPYLHSEITLRDLSEDSQGHVWFGEFANNKVGYFYLAGADEHNGK